MSQPFSTLFGHTSQYSKPCPRIEYEDGYILTDYHSIMSQRGHFSLSIMNISDIPISLRDDYYTKNICQSIDCLATSGCMKLEYYIQESDNKIREEPDDMIKFGINKYKKMYMISNSLNNRFNILNRLFKDIKSHFGEYRIFYTGTMRPVGRMLLYDWISTYSDQFRKRMLIEKKLNKNDFIIKNSSFFIKFDNRTFGLILIGDKYRQTIETEDLIKSEIGCIEDDVMYIYIFGRHVYQYIKSLESKLSLDDAKIRLYTISCDTKNGRGFSAIFQNVTQRPMNTIFMEHGIVEDIFSHIDKFISNKKLYAGRGIIYKTGILLYGEPGTGKTSLIRAIASLYNRDILSIDMTKFDKISIDELTSSINLDEDSNYIIALEDIDCVVADRENDSINRDDEKVINKLLSFLDSNSSPNNVIFIATTNHIELLDKALLREGRFDLKKEVTGIYLNKSIEMCKSFGLNQHQINNVLNIAKESGIDLIHTPIQQAKLQSFILQQTDMSLNVES